MWRPKQRRKQVGGWANILTYKEMDHLFFEGVEQLWEKWEEKSRQCTSIKRAGNARKPHRLNMNGAKKKSCRGLCWLKNSCKYQCWKNLTQKKLPTTLRHKKLNGPPPSSTLFTSSFEKTSECAKKCTRAGRCWILNFWQNPVVLRLGQVFPYFTQSSILGWVMFGFYFRASLSPTKRRPRELDLTWVRRELLRALKHFISRKYNILRPLLLLWTCFSRVFEVRREE